MVKARLKSLLFDDLITEVAEWQQQHVDLLNLVGEVRAQDAFKALLEAVEEKAPQSVDEVLALLEVALDIQVHLFDLDAQLPELLLLLCLVALESLHICLELADLGLPLTNASLDLLNLRGGLIKAILFFLNLDLLVPQHVQLLIQSCLIVLLFRSGFLDLFPEAFDV